MPGMKAAWLMALGVSLAATLSAQDEAKDQAKWDCNKVHGPSQTVEFTVDQGTWMNLDLSPDGQTLVFDLLGDIFALPIEGGKAKALQRGPAFTVQPRFSPDGSKIAFTSDAGGGDNIWVMNADGSGAEQVTEEDYRLCNNPAWTADGKFLIARKHYTATRSLGAGEMWLYSLAGGKGVQLTERRDDQHDAGEPETSPDGRFLYYSEDVSPGKVFEYNRDPNGLIYAIKLLDLDTGETLTLAQAPGGNCRPEVSPSGKSLAFVRRIRGKSALMVMDLETGAERQVYSELSKDSQESWSVFGVYPNFAWTPDSQAVVIWAKGKLRRVDLATGEAAEIPFTAIARHKIRDALRYSQDIGTAQQDVRVIRWPQLSPDGNTVYFQALGQIYVHDVQSGDQRRLTDAKHLEYYPCLSADGNKLAYTTWDDQKGGRVMLYDFASQESIVLVDKPGHYAWPSFDLEGERLLYQRLGSGSTRGSAFVLQPGIYMVDLHGSTRRFIRRHGQRPRFHPKQARILLLGKEDKNTALESYSLGGHDRRVLATSKHAIDILLSPDGQHVAWQELFHTYLSPMPATGNPVHLAPERKDLPVQKLSKDAGEYLAFSADGKTLCHSLAASLTVHAIGKEADSDQSFDLGFAVDSDQPETNVILEHGRIISMEGEQIIDDGYVHVKGNRIQAIGNMQDLPSADGVTHIDLEGKTVLPGFVDVHAHMPSGNSGMLPQNN